MSGRPEYEENRVKALHRFGLLDTPQEKIFDGITLAIANICEVPISLVSLVDHDRQWFKSTHGLNAKETPRDYAFCAHAIEKPQALMIVEDAMQDDRFRDNPLVTNDPQIRFYAGKPLISQDGYPLGTLCVIDRQPRKLKPYQYDSLVALSETVAAIFTERERIKTVAIDKESTEEVVRERAVRYQHLYENTEAVLSGILGQLVNPAAIVGSTGTIVAVNAAWPQFADVSADHVGVGSGLRDIRRQVEGPFEEKGSEILKGLEAVLCGVSPCYQVSYALRGIEYNMVAKPIMRDHANGILVQHIADNRGQIDSFLT